MEKIKIVLFAANPRGTAPLDLPREFREIDEEVSRGTFRDVVELILVPGTRIEIVGISPLKRPMPDMDHDWASASRTAIGVRSTVDVQHPSCTL